jgi:MFS transporter, LPLT family, lysophospholipid transporter
MNALLQHRGHHLVGAGRSIAVQEQRVERDHQQDRGILVEVLHRGFSIFFVIVAFGLFVAGTMTLVQVWYWRNLRRHGDEVERLLAFARAEDPHHPRHKP